MISLIHCTTLLKTICTKVSCKVLFSRDVHQIILRNEDDKSIRNTYKVIHAIRDKHQNEIYIVAGWYEFKKLYNLKKGNIVANHKSKHTKNHFDHCTCMHLLNTLQQKRVWITIENRSQKFKNRIIQS